jgi:hypothetical protein
MRTVPKRLPAPAMLVACIALIVAVGGVSYAAGVLPKNSVGTAQLKKKAVTGGKLKENAVTGAKVKNGSLLAADFKPGQLPAGEQGPKGDPGPQGPKGDPGVPGANSVGAGEIKDGSIGTAQFAHSIPAVKVTGPSDGAVATNTATPLMLGIERYDTAGMHETGANNSRLTAPVDGIFLVTAQVRWQYGTGDRWLELRKNGSHVIAAAQTEYYNSSESVSQEVTTQVRLGAGDYIQAVVRQSNNSSSPLSIVKHGEYSPEFAMTWLAPGP